MTFLNPTILFGLFAAAIPIVLHFLNLRKLQKVEFSTLAFLKELQKNKIRRIKLKQWLLLLLRILIIISLVFAFSRPAVKSDWIGSSAAKTTAVFVIDNTISMSVIGDEGSYLNESKELAKELLKNFMSGDEIAVLPYNNNSTTQIKPVSDFDIVIKQINDIQVSPTRKTLNDILISAGKILYDSKNYNKEIYLFTDLQEGSLFNNETGLSPLNELLKNTKFFFFNLSKKSSINLGIDSVRLNTQIFEKNKQINFSASIKNYSKSESAGSVVSLFINNKRSAQQNIFLNAKEKREVSFETTLNDTGFVNASIELEDDDILLDNKRFTSFYVPDKIKLLVLYDINDDLQFLRLVLNNPVLNNFKVTEMNVLQLTSQNLQNFDAVILVALPPENSIPQLMSYLNNGGGLLFFPPSNSNINSIQNFFNQLDIPKPENFIGKKNSSDLSTNFEKVDFNHPIFSNLFEDKTKTKLDSPEIYYYMKLFPGANGKSIITLYDKSAFLSEFKIGFGKLLVFNTSPVLSWGNFPLKSIFPALISKSILFLSSQNRETENIFCGDEIYINKPAAKQLKVVYPDDSIELINLDSLINQKYVRFINTGLIGTYRFYNGNQLIDFRSINHNPEESVVEYHSVSDLKNYFEKISLDTDVIVFEENQNISQQIYNSRFGTELWKYFIIAALIFALIEMAVARSSKKDLKQQN